MYHAPSLNLIAVIARATPEGVEVDYMSTLKGFKNLGELLTALHYFAKMKLYPKKKALMRSISVQYTNL